MVRETSWFEKRLHEFGRVERHQIIDPFADPDVLHRDIQILFHRDGHTTARSAVQLGQNDPRYPYGREATVSWPAPDLKIRNTTPHGILIWPSYDSVSITVRLYSTPFVSVEQTGQYTSRGSSWCSVTTERTRTYAEGTSAVDSTTASYRSC